MILETNIGQVELVDVLTARAGWRLMQSFSKSDLTNVTDLPFEELIPLLRAVVKSVPEGYDLDAVETFENMDFAAFQAILTHATGFLQNVNPN
jgi:hypothetical protein